MIIYKPKFLQETHTDIKHSAGFRVKILKMFLQLAILLSSAGILTINCQASYIPNANNYNELNLTFTLSASGLPNTGLKSIDPYIKVYSAIGDTEPEKFGTTDVVENTANPEFNTAFSYLWKKGTNQKWIFKVKDQRALSDTTLGEAIVDVDQYVTMGQKMNVSLSKDVEGNIIVQKTTPIRFRLFARQLPRLDFGRGKSDPFVKIYWRRGSHGKEHKLGTTQIIDNVENADWDETFEFPNYIKGADLWWTFKVKDSDVGRDEDMGEALLEIDPFVQKRQTKIVNLGKDGKGATLGIIPA